MNRYCFAVACALTLLLLAPAHAGTALPLEKAFLGLPWGADIREHDGFKFLHGKAGLRCYAKPGVVRMANGIRVEQVIYGTYNYNFFAAFLVLDQALLVDGGPLQDAAEFVKRLNRVMARGLET